GSVASISTVTRRQSSERICPPVAAYRLRTRLGEGMTCPVSAFTGAMSATADIASHIFAQHFGPFMIRPRDPRLKEGAITCEGGRVRERKQACAPGPCRPLPTARGSAGRRHHTHIAHGSATSVKRA